MVRCPALDGICMHMPGMFYRESVSMLDSSVCWLCYDMAETNKGAEMIQANIPVEGVDHWQCFGSEFRGFLVRLFELHFFGALVDGFHSTNLKVVIT